MVPPTVEFSQPVAVWQNLDGPNTMVYLLYKRSRRSKGRLGSVRRRHKWTELRTKYFAPLNGKVSFMTATDHWRLK
jgi:hypothetical protein